MRFAIIETTRNSKKSFYYIGKKNVLSIPRTVRILLGFNNEKTITYRYKNQIKRDPEYELDQLAMTQFYEI